MIHFRYKLLNRYGAADGFLSQRLILEFWRRVPQWERKALSCCGNCATQAGCIPSPRNRDERDGTEHPRFWFGKGVKTTRRVGHPPVCVVAPGFLVEGAPADNSRVLKKSGIAKFILDTDRTSTTIWLWIGWVQHLRLCLIPPVGQ
jgi:hypothetical protein